MPGWTSSRPHAHPVLSEGARLLRGAPTPCSGLWERRAGPPSRSRLSWTWTAVLGFTAGHRGRLPSGAPITSSPIVFWGQGGGQTWVLSTSPSSPGGRWQTGHFRSLQSPELHLPPSTLPPRPVFLLPTFQPTSFQPLLRQPAVSRDGGVGSCSGVGLRGVAGSGHHQPVIGNT